MRISSLFNVIARGPLPTPTRPSDTTNNTTRAIASFPPSSIQTEVTILLHLYNACHHRCDSQREVYESGGSCCLGNRCIHTLLVVARARAFFSEPSPQSVAEIRDEKAYNSVALRGVGLLVIGHRSCRSEVGKGWKGLREEVTHAVWSPMKIARISKKYSVKAAWSRQESGCIPPAFYTRRVDSTKASVALLTSSYTMSFGPGSIHITK